MKKSLFIIVLALACLSARGQRPGYAISFYQVFDNREYFSEFAFPQTIFGARLDASLVFSIDTMHSFAAGLNYLYEHGSSVLGAAPQVNLYYTYKTDQLEMALGSFPRKDRIEMPLVFLTDTLHYYRPNVEGGYIAFGGRHLEAYGFVDWTGRVSETTREAFLAGMDATVSVAHFFVNPSFLMYHQARSYDPADVRPIRDNGVFSMMAGALVGDTQGFSMRLSAGYIASYNRLRPEDLTWGKGWITNIDLRYTIFGFKGVYYFGTPIAFEYGDPFYRAGNYGRMDIFADPFRLKNIDSKIGWSFHFVPGEGLHHSQQLLICVWF
ncbi:MAG: hypothetical protein P1P82_13005 [Bacteroidales bacterium]|nr:hypothetical protein [Bacteroidales bacterium]MDT8432737.1 hypothetical protein [Bacteroidales bacterium]